MISRKQLALVLSPFLVIAAVFYFALKKDIASGLTPIELEVYGYTTGTVLTESDMKKRPTLDIPQTLRGVLYVESRGAQQAARPGIDKGYSVSFILISRDDKIAMINDAIVREGDILDNRKVARIEKDRVALMTNGITTWVKLEDQ